MRSDDLATASVLLRIGADITVKDGGGDYLLLGVEENAREWGVEQGLVV